MSNTQPINIPRKLASSVPPHVPPNFTSPPISSSFDQYCGHIESASGLRKHWKNHVRSFKDSFMKNHLESNTHGTNLKHTPNKNK